MIFVCVYPTFKQWLNRIGRTLAVPCLNTVQTWYVRPSQPKIWRNFQKIGGVWTLETLTFRMYAFSSQYLQMYFLSLTNLDTESEANQSEADTKAIFYILKLISCKVFRVLGVKGYPSINPIFILFSQTVTKLCYGLIETSL